MIWPDVVEEGGEDEVLGCSFRGSQVELFWGRVSSLICFLRLVGGLERVFELADVFADVVALAVLFEAVDEVVCFLEGS